MRFMSIFMISRAIIPYLLERGMSYLLERWWGLNGDTARRLGPLLSQGCQFAFGLLAADAIQGVMGEPTANLLKLAVTLSMAATSLDAGLDKEGRRNPLGCRLHRLLFARTMDGQMWTKLLAATGVTACLLAATAQIPVHPLDICL
jgi:hypothetical protein